MIIFKIMLTYAAGNGTPILNMTTVDTITIISTKFKVGLKIQLRIIIKIFMTAFPNKVRSLYTYGYGLQVLYCSCFYYMGKFYLVICLKLADIF